MSFSNYCLNQQYLTDYCKGFWRIDTRGLFYLSLVDVNCVNISYVCSGQDKPVIKTIHRFWTYLARHHTSEWELKHIHQSCLYNYDSHYVQWRYVGNRFKNNMFINLWTNIQTYRNYWSLDCTLCLQTIVASRNPAVVLRQATHIHLLSVQIVWVSAGFYREVRICFPSSRKPGDIYVFETYFPFTLNGIFSAENRDLLFSGLFVLCVFIIFW